MPKSEQEYEAKIAELEQRIRDLEFRSLPLGPRPKTDAEVLEDNRLLDAIIEDVKKQTGGDLLVGDEIPPVDRSKRCMLSGNPETPDHRDLRPDGMQKDYVVLCPQERAKGFVRPVRRTYLHKPCGTTTTMGLALAETYARDPYFYSGTFCCHCAAHFPLDQFVWDGTNEQVGS